MFKCANICETVPLTVELLYYSSSSHETFGHEVLTGGELLWTHTGILPIPAWKMPNNIHNISNNTCTNSTCDRYKLMRNAFTLRTKIAFSLKSMFPGIYARIHPVSYFCDTVSQTLAELWLMREHCKKEAFHVIFVSVCFLSSKWKRRLSKSKFLFLLFDSQALSL